MASKTTYESVNAACDGREYWCKRGRLSIEKRDKLSISGNDRLILGFQRCLDSNKYTVKIRQDLAEAQRVGVQATPSFLLGVAEPDGSSVKVVKMIAGAHPYTVFKEAIDSLLSIEKLVAPKR